MLTFLDLKVLSNIFTNVSATFYMMTATIPFIKTDPDPFVILYNLVSAIMYYGLAVILKRFYDN